jgi:hypothetical protein
MRRERVHSEALRSVGYDPDARILEIEFNSGTVYRYFDVPPNVHAGLMTATSKGEYYAENVRAAGFEYEQRR